MVSIVRMSLPLKYCQYAHSSLLNQARRAIQTAIKQLQEGNLIPDADKVCVLTRILTVPDPKTKTYALKLFIIATCRILTAWVLLQASMTFTITLTAKPP